MYVEQPIMMNGVSMKCFALYTAKIGIIFLSLILLSTSVFADRTFTWKGHEWVVRGEGFGGPGPNYWSDSTDSVWVDEHDRLHLKIRNENNVWRSAEIYTREPMTYGRYVWEVESRYDLYDKSTVGGLFIYQDDNHEIDIEFAKWGNRFQKNVTNYTLQPGGTYTTRHNPRLEGTHTSQLLIWRPSYLVWATFGGHYGAYPPESQRISEGYYSIARNIPPATDGTRLHLNLWLYQGVAPESGSGDELIISDFYFIPTGD